MPPPGSQPAGGTSGPVGSGQEQNTIGALFPDLIDPSTPGQPGTAGLLDLFAGPILRAPRW